MSFPTELSNAIDGVTEIVAAHLNNLEAKVGTDNSAVVTSIDYLLKNTGSIDPGHKHTAEALSDGNNGEVLYKAAGTWGPGTPEAAGLVAKNGDQSIAGVKTFTSIPLGPSSNPTTDNHLARKAYVDLMLPLAGGTMSGNISMNSYKITGLGTASGTGEALRYDEWIAAQDPGHKHSKLWASEGGPEVVTVDASGNVGVGTTNPLGLLQIGNSIVSRIIFNNGWLQEFATTGGSGISCNIYYSGGFKYRTTAAGLRLDISGGSYNFYTSPSGTGDTTPTQTSRMYIDNGGNIGIGKTSPGYLLDMETSGGGYYSTADHSWHNGSSIRWKEDIKPIDNPLVILQQLTGVTFKWKKTRLPGMSLIAEEVGRVVPEAVSYSQTEPDFCDGFNPGALVGLLVEAVKAQQIQIAALQAKFN